MNIVTQILDQIDTGVLSAGQTFFTNTATSIAPLVTIFLTLLLVMLGLNIALNVYKISMRDSMQIAVRIVVVLMFGLTWTNFGVLYDALSSGTGSMALSFFSTMGADLGTKVPGVAMDNFSTQMANTVDVVSEAQGSIMRGLVSALLYVILGLLMSAYVLITAFSKIMIAFLLGVAPIAIMSTIFEKTKNIFEAWLGALIGYLMYPLASAAIIGSVVLVAKQNFTQIDNVTDFGSILGFLVMCFVGIFALFAIPTSVANITGQINLANFAPEALRAVGKPLVTSKEYSAARFAQMKSGFLHGTTAGLAQKSAERRDADLGAAARAKIDMFTKARRT
jgi:type IV secretion system protein VirB6